MPAGGRVEISKFSCPRLEKSGQWGVMMMTEDSLTLTAPVMGAVGLLLVVEDITAPASIF
jgi:hypothetical protein